MKGLATLLLLLFAAPSPEIRYFRFERPVTTPAQTAGQTCAIVDPGIFPHASAELADLRLYRGDAETAYVLHSTAPASSSTQKLSVLNLGKSGVETVFDAAMPAGSYNDVELGIEAHDFLATVTVTGRQTQAGGEETKLGSFTIFDLTQQRLGRSTILHLPQSDFRFLHFQISGSITPQNVTGISVTTAPANQAKYVTIAQTATVTQKGRDSVYQFTVPPRTPVDRIVFVPDAQPANFSRDVLVKVLAHVRPSADDSGEPPLTTTTSTNILRVHRVQTGQRIDEEKLVVDAPYAYFDAPGVWTVTVENGDDTPVPMASVRLDMIERDLCFDATADATYTLYYGDSALGAPQYDYAALFAPAANAAVAQLGTEISNSAYQPRPDTRAFTEKHPALLWAALIVVMVLLGAVAIRSVKGAQVKPS